MSRRRRARSARLAWDSWMLGMEAATVMGQRGFKIAAGGRAGKTETRRMVREKLDAALAWQILAATGGLGRTPPAAAAKTLRHYRRKVQANRRRLAKL